MKDKRLIEDLISRTEEARKKLRDNLSGLSPAQLNWKPDPESWSIGQCLDHLVVSDCLYFPAFKKITEEKYQMSFWEKWSPFSRLFGKMLTDQVQEEPRRKMIAPRVLRPSTSKIDPGIYERFNKHLDSLQEYIGLCTQKDLDRIKVSSPVSKFITYSLRNAFRLLTQHEHRHLNQAIRIKQAKEFPLQ